MRELKYVMIFIIGIITFAILFNIADALHPKNLILNHILLGIVELSWGFLIALFYKDGRPND